MFCILYVNNGESFQNKLTEALVGYICTNTNKTQIIEPGSPAHFDDEQLVPHFQKVSPGVNGQNIL